MRFEASWNSAGDNPLLPDRIAVASALCQDFAVFAAAASRAMVDGCTFGEHFATGR
jgi:hypothetical protein